MIKKLIVVLAALSPNFLKISFYRMIGYKIGKGVKIGYLTIILANKVIIGDNVKIGSMNVFKMNELKIGDESRIRSLNMMLGPRNLILGKRIQIVGPFTFMNLAEDIELDDFCGIGSHSVFYTHGVYLPYTEGHPRKFGKIYLGKRVWSPCHVVFLPGTSVGDDSIISAGSILNSTFPENSFISGSPAKRISNASNLKKKIDDKEFQRRVKEIISDFARDPSLEGSEIIRSDGQLIIKKKNKKSLVRIYSGKIDAIEDYNEIIIIGRNLPENSNKKITLFDLNTRKTRLNGELSRIFINHLGTYGEDFI